MFYQNIVGDCIIEECMSGFMLQTGVGRGGEEARKSFANKIVPKLRILRHCFTVIKHLPHEMWPVETAFAVMHLLLKSFQDKEEREAVSIRSRNNHTKVL